MRHPLPPHAWHLTGHTPTILLSFPSLLYHVFPHPTTPPARPLSCCRRLSTASLTPPSTLLHIPVSRLHHAFLVFPPHLPHAAMSCPPRHPITSLISGPPFPPRLLTYLSCLGHLPTTPPAHSTATPSSSSHQESGVAKGSDSGGQASSIRYRGPDIEYKPILSLLFLESRSIPFLMVPGHTPGLQTFWAREIFPFFSHTWTPPRSYFEMPLSPQWRGVPISMLGPIFLLE